MMSTMRVTAAHKRGAAAVLAKGKHIIAQRLHMQSCIEDILGVCSCKLLPGWTSAPVSAFHPKEKRIGQPCKVAGEDLP